MEFEQHTNLGEHGAKLYHDGMFLVYETPTGGDSILLIDTQTSVLFAFLERHISAVQGEMPEGDEIDASYQELPHPAKTSSTTKYAVRFLQERVLRFSIRSLPVFDLSQFDLSQQEVTNLYHFLSARREAFQCQKVASDN